MPLERVDYLVIGHLARDLTKEGSRLGGTVAYAGLTAQALGMRVGIVTACGGDTPLESLDGICIISVPSKDDTTFAHIHAPGRRIQYIRSVASRITFENIPEAWRRTPIIHVGPIAQEAKSVLNGPILPTLLGLTPQGWLRSWNGSGRVQPCKWTGVSDLLPKFNAIVLSIEDINEDEEQIEAMALASRVLVVTEGQAGARLYWHGDLRRFSAPAVDEIDATGAGDIFAASFFWRLYLTRDPWEAARFATKLATYSVTRNGLDSIPTKEEIRNCLVEVF